MEFPQDNGAQPLPPGFNFSPYSIELGVRVRMRISSEDFKMVALSSGDIGVVTDLDTGTQYRVFDGPRVIADDFANNITIELVTEEVPL